MAKTRLHFEIDGVDVSVSSPEKVYFPEAGITKLEVVEHFRAVAPAALRAAGGRPLVLKRYVNGAAKEAFYQKRAPPTRPDWVDTVTLRFPSGRKADEVVLRNEAQLVWAVNLGCIELHVHPVRAEDLEHPDELRIDLDPVPGIEWPQILEVGFVTRGVLDRLGLVGWPKTSGSRGLHIYVRLHPRWGFTEVRRAALAIARQVEREAPALATSKWWKEERRGVFLDYNQNAKDRTIAAAWSVRPTKDARVSMPLTWDELEAAEPGDFTLKNAAARFAEHGDPHEAMDAHPCDLSAALELVARHEAEGLGDGYWPPHYIKTADEPTRAQPSRRRKRAALPVIEIGRAKAKADALAGLERWKARHPAVVPHLKPADVLTDRMRGRHTEWTRIRVNLQHVPEDLRPPQEALDPDYDVAREWGGPRAGDDVELPKLRGVSRNKLLALHEALGVTSVEELEEAAQAGRVRGVKGFGPKTEAKILEAIAAQRERAGWWLSSEALAVAEAARARLAPVVARIEVAGALRRGEEVVDRVVLVAAVEDGSAHAERGASGGRASPDFEQAVARLEQRLAAPEAASEGPEEAPTSGGDAAAAAAPAPTGREASVFEHARTERAGEGLAMVHARALGGPPIEVSVVRAERFGAAWQHATASEGHLEALCARAGARGLELTRRGLFEGGAPVETPDEGQVADALGVPLLPPELRRGGVSDLEVPAPQDLLRIEDLEGMVHCHTTWSDGKNSVEAMARAAEARGFEYITITDHSSSAFYANGLTTEELKRQWDEIDLAQQNVSIRILKGVESDILLDGALDYPAAVLERLDVVIASVHSRFRLDEAKMTERLVRTMKLPIFKIWGHPLGRLLLRRDPVGVDLERVFDALAASRGAIEINADPRRLDLPAEHVRAARARKLSFVVSADAHSVEGMGVLDHGVALARRAGLTRGEVLNTLPADAFAAAVRPAG